MVSFTDAERQRIAEAVAAAEAGTDAEIVTIVAPKSDAYNDVGLHYAVLAMLLVPVGLALVPQAWIDWAVGLVLGWDAHLTRGLVMLYIFVKMAAAFLIVRYALAYMPLRMALTPGSTKVRRVRRRATELFKAACLGRTKRKTAVLLYLSVAERRAEIVVDDAIHGKVDAAEWGEAMAALVAEVKAGRPGEGMAQAVERIGKVLAAHVPAVQGDNPNEIPDGVIEI
jgi:putative membrane protein